MRVLSLRQPWLWLVLHAGKDLENRTWWSNVRGTVLLHAAKGMTVHDMVDAERFLQERQINITLPGEDELLRGGICGRVKITGGIRPCKSESLCERPWHMHEQCGFELEGAASISFVPYRGQLGFFEIDSVPEHALLQGAERRAREELNVLLREFAADPKP